MYHEELHEQTVQKLTSALLLLLKDKPLHRITIKELCAEASVNRTTFYKYYGSQYDLFDSIADSFFSGLQEIYSRHPKSDYEGTLKHTAEVYRYLEDHRTLTLTLYYNMPSEQFMERYISIPAIKHVLSRGITEEAVAEGRSVYFIYGTIPIVIHWLELEKRCSAKEEAKKILDIVYSA